MHFPKLCERIFTMINRLPIETVCSRAQFTILFKYFTKKRQKKTIQHFFNEQSNAENDYLTNH